LDRSNRRGDQVERLRVKSLHPIEALIQLVGERRPWLLVFGPDRTKLSRRMYRRAARTLRRQIDCLVWLPGEQLHDDSKGGASPARQHSDWFAPNASKITNDAIAPLFEVSLYLQSQNHNDYISHSPNASDNAHPLPSWNLRGSRSRRARSGGGFGLPRAVRERRDPSRSDDRLEMALPRRVADA
jgi:hypothetical protein